MSTDGIPIGPMVQVTDEMLKSRFTDRVKGALQAGDKIVSVNIEEAFSDEQAVASYIRGSIIDVSGKVKSDEDLPPAVKSDYLKSCAEGVDYCNAVVSGRKEIIRYYNSAQKWPITRACYQVYNKTIGHFTNVSYVDAQRLNGVIQILARGMISDAPLERQGLMGLVWGGVTAGASKLVAGAVATVGVVENVVGVVGNVFDRFTNPWHAVSEAHLGRLFGLERSLTEEFVSEEELNHIYQNGSPETIANTGRFGARIANGVRVDVGSNAYNITVGENGQYSVTGADEKFKSFDKVMAYLGGKGVLSRETALGQVQEREKQALNVQQETEKKIGFQSDTPATIERTFDELGDALKDRVACWPFKDGNTDHLMIKFGKDIYDCCLDYLTGLEDKKVYISVIGKERRELVLLDVNTDGIDLVKTVCQLLMNTSNLSTVAPLNVIMPPQIRTEARTAQEENAKRAWEKETKESLLDLKRTEGGWLGFRGRSHRFANIQNLTEEKLGALASRDEGVNKSVGVIVSDEKSVGLQIAWPDGTFQTEGLQIVVDGNQKKFWISGKESVKYSNLKDFLQSDLLKDVLTVSEAQTVIANREQAEEQRRPQEDSATRQQSASPAAGAVSPDLQEEKIKKAIVSPTTHIENLKKRFNPFYGRVVSQNKLLHLTDVTYYWTPAIRFVIWLRVLGRVLDPIPKVVTLAMVQETTRGLPLDERQELLRLARDGGVGPKEIFTDLDSKGRAEAFLEEIQR